MRQNNRFLREVFKEFNHDFFNNQFSKRTIIKFKKLPGLMGRAFSRVYVGTRPTTSRERRENKLSKKSWVMEYAPKIYISDELRHSTRQIVMTLFHEMAH